MQLFIGIDGGGTTTRAVASDAEGREIARVEGGAGLVRAAEPAAGSAALADLVDQVVREAGGRLPVASLCCALAGAGREPERQALAAALAREAVAERVRIATDAEAAFYDAFGDGPGMLLIAGTGSIVWGRAPDGRSGRAGGWGALLGDEGSGYALGLGALLAVMRAEDGRADETMLRAPVLSRTGVAAPPALVAWSAAATKADIAALTPLVFAAADQGDPAARALVRAAANDLADHVAALHRRLGPWHDAAGLVLSGGLITRGRPLRATLLDVLAARGVALRLVDRDPDAASGAAAMARAAAPTRA